MKTLIRIALLCVFTLGAGSAFAQTVTINAPGGSFAPGQNIVVPVNFTQGATQIGGLDVQINVSTAQFSAIALDCTVQTIGATSNVCSTVNAASGEVSIRLSGNGSAQLVTGLLANVTLTVAGGASPNASEQIDATVEGVGDVSGDNDLPLNTITLVEDTVNIAGPAYSSSPVAGGGTEFTFGPVVQNAALPSQNLIITNSGVGTLSGTCSETLDAGNVFTVTNGAYSATAGGNDTVTVACSSAGAINTHTGTMSCTHNGGNVASPVVYDLSCTITTGPQPAYASSNPTAGGAINLAVTEAGDPNPTQSLTITNSGNPTTTLTGSCAMGGGDSEITLTSAGAFSIVQGAAGSVKTVSCDASVEGSYSNTLSCTHNGSAPASPVNYAVSCTVPPAGSAVFASSPAPGAIDVDNGADVVVADTDPTRNLTLFNNADPGDQQLDIDCSLSGDSAISVQPDISSGILIAANANSQVTFSCDTATAGDFTATYTCNYGNGGLEGPDGQGSQAVYSLTCGVREPESQVEISPASGTPQTASVPPGGSTSFEFDFAEVNDEGVDGSLISCELETGGQGFTITTPTFPTDVPAGQTVTVGVEFNDPTGADSWSDTLTCMYSDSDDDDTEVSWPLTVNLGGNAIFHVLKDFTDDNPGDVIVDLSCNTGLILDQQKSISEDGIGVSFVVTDFDAGELECSVTERPVAGYITSYDTAGDSTAAIVNDDDEPGCYFSEVAGGDENTCYVANDPDFVDVVITKEWVYPSASASEISTEFEVVLYCDDAEIAGGSELGDIYAPEAPAAYVDSCAYANVGPEAPGSSSDTWCKTLEGSGNSTFTEQVKPYDWPGGSCWAVEVDVDQAVEVDNGCASPMSVSVGSGASCTIVNTVFFEGIPTLSQYGMALMALLMLGVGFVAMRRIV